MRKKMIATELGLLTESSQDVEHRYALHAHPSLLSHFNVGIRQTAPPLPSGKPRWLRLAPNTPLDELKRATSWFIFIGAEITPEMLDVMRQAIVYVFDPDREKMSALIERLELPALVKKNIFFFSGDPDLMPEPLYFALPAEITELGPPVFFTSSALPEDYTLKIKRTLEIFYYHHQLYPYEGVRSFDDKRPVLSWYSYQHFRHFTENLGLLAGAQGVDVLKDRFPEGNVLFVGAGPSFDDCNIDLVRHVAGNHIIVCASKSCRKLLELGVTPDIVLLMDSSPRSAAELADLNLESSILVCYTLAGARAVQCKKMLFFGQELGQLGLTENAIDHLGSVANYAFFLARHMGCRHLFCIGLDLGSYVSLGRGYSSRLAPTAENEQSWPCPVYVPGMNYTLFTTLNFLDVTEWIKAEVIKYGLVVQVAIPSILFGKNITQVYSTGEVISNPNFIFERPIALPKTSLPPQTREQAMKVLETYRQLWGAFFHPQNHLTPDNGQPLHVRFQPLLKHLDDYGVSHLLKSAPGYDAAAFVEDFFSDDGARRDRAAASCMECLESVARELSACAEESLKMWDDVAERG